MPSDPSIETARDIIRDLLLEIRQSIEGLSVEGLNWQPVNNATNSLAVLAVHAVSSTRDWLCIALERPQPARDRDAEFRTEAVETAKLLTFVDSASNDCLCLLDEDGTFDWTAARKTWDYSQAASGEVVTAAWALLHAVEHLREHMGQMLLTRQLWEQLPGSSSTGGNAAD